MREHIHANKGLYILLLVVLILRIVLFPFAQTVDADAVTRTYFSQDWLEFPHWIMTGVWLPIHYYLNALILWIWNDPIYAPGILNSLLALIMLVPFYHMVKREFSSEGALMITAILAFSPILFRNQFMGLSETPFLFFLIFSFNFLSIGTRKNALWAIALSGVCITIASGIRYEAWLIVLITTSFLLIKNPKKAIVYGFFGGLFPLIWLYTNFLETGDWFYSLKGNHHYTLEIVDTNANVSTEAYLRRIWFFPFSLLIAIGPIALIDSLRNWIERIKRPKFTDIRFLLALLFVIFLVFFIYNSFQGTLLLHHRFIGTLIIFILPFASYCMTSRKLGRISFHITLMIGLSYIYNMDHIQPIPRLKDQNIGTLYTYIPDSTEHLIVDAIGWDYTYYLELHSGIDRKNIIAVEGAQHSPDKRNTILNLLSTSKNITCILRKGSDVERAIASRFQLQTIHTYDGYLVQKK